MEAVPRYACISHQVNKAMSLPLCAFVFIFVFVCLCCQHGRYACLPQQVARAMSLYLCVSVFVFVCLVVNVATFPRYARLSHQVDKLKKQFV